MASKVELVRLILKDVLRVQITEAEAEKVLERIEDLHEKEAVEHHAHLTGFPPNHRDNPFCECDVCMGFVSRTNRPQVA